MSSAMGASAGPDPEVPSSMPPTPPTPRSGRSPLEPWIEAELAASERRTIFVDGFNVLHTVLLAGERDSIWWGRSAREKLLTRVCAWPDSSDEIWVAFDGSQPAWSMRAIPVPPGAGERRPRVHSVFVESADDWIVRRARRAAEPARAVVVSADRKVAGRARSAGCVVWSPWAFVAGCTDGANAEAASPAAANAAERALGIAERAALGADQVPVEPEDGAGGPDGASSARPRPSPSALS